MTRNVYIYTRVSSDKQELSPEHQEKICRSYYEQNLAPKGYVLGQTFADLGQSAFSIPWSEREQGRELFKVLKSGDTVIVAKQDRAWRSVRDKENTMFFFRQVGIDLAVLDMNIDTSTASGKFAAGIVALQAQWESDVRSERMKAAFAVRRARRSPGIAKPPPGWKATLVNGKLELVPDEQERKLLAQVYQWSERKVRSIECTARWLRENGVRRSNGCLYRKDWLRRAYAAYLTDYPLQGFTKCRTRMAYAAKMGNANGRRMGWHTPQGKPPIPSPAEARQILQAAPVLLETASPPDGH